MLAGCQVPKSEWDFAAQEFVVTGVPIDYQRATMHPFGCVVAAKIKVPGMTKEMERMSMGL